jgi:DNA-binding HxlR family transcriptional regulator
LKTFNNTFKKTVGDVLCSPPRLNIVIAIDEKTRGFAELQKLSHLSSGTLGYHLLKAQVAGIVTKNSENRYAITPLGQKVAAILNQVNEDSAIL